MAAGRGLQLCNLLALLPPHRRASYLPLSLSLSRSAILPLPLSCCVIVISGSASVNARQTVHIARRASHTHHTLLPVVLDRRHLENEANERHFTKWRPPHAVTACSSSSVQCAICSCPIVLAPLSLAAFAALFYAIFFCHFICSIFACEIERNEQENRQGLYRK